MMRPICDHQALAAEFAILKGPLYSIQHEGASFQYDCSIHSAEGDQQEGLCGCWIAVHCAAGWLKQQHKSFMERIRITPG